MVDLTKEAGYVPGFPNELNLRELGGLPTADGRHVRHGLFFRGSSLAALDAREAALVDDMGLASILDLRAAGEVSMDSDYVPAGCSYERIGGMRFENGEEVDFSPGAIEEFLRSYPDLFADGTFMRSLYTSMAFGNPAMHALVSRVVERQVPIYVHCTAGKDRTGVATLVLCLLLGVTHDAIVRDFLLTNTYRKSIIDSALEHLPQGASQEDIDHWRHANGVDRSDLDAVYDAIMDRCGSPEKYVEQEFGLGIGQVFALRDLYLE